MTSSTFLSFVFDLEKIPRTGTAQTLDFTGRNGILKKVEKMTIFFGFLDGFYPDPTPNG